MLREWHRDYRRKSIRVDPWQAARSIATLKAAGLPIEEAPQVPSLQTRAAEALSTLITEGQLVVYPSDELRTAVINAALIESPRGVRLAKASTTRRIDLCTALSLAALSALEAPRHAPAFVA